MSGTIVCNHEKSIIPGATLKLTISDSESSSFPIFEYAPKKIKMSVTGSGTASKEQVALLLRKFMEIDTSSETLDETDAIAIAYCHHLQGSLPSAGNAKSRNWKDFVKKNPDKIV